MDHQDHVPTAEYGKPAEAILLPLVLHYNHCVLLHELHHLLVRYQAARRR